MNAFEFGSKTLFFYSVKKNDRIDLSSLPDDVFDAVVGKFWKTRMCKEGNPFTGKFVMEKAKCTPFTNWLITEIAPTYPWVKKFIAFLNGLGEGEVFRIVSQDAPTMNKQLAVMKTKALATGVDEQLVHNRYLMTWGLLSSRFRHFAFGYDGLRAVVGEGARQKRVCRFCGKMMPEVTFDSVAHAISEGLGNKLLICNEECDKCNNKLSKTESNLMHYLDIRRTMGGILSKTDGTVPSVDGKGFVIRGDANNHAVLYLEKESITVGLDTSKPFSIKLETTDTITHQGIYKALCKTVIDLLPAAEMAHFTETIGWINGSVLDNELPSYLATYGREFVNQPTVDIFLSNKPGLEPYCTAIAHVLDALFVFVLPEVDVDKAQFKTFGSIEHHLGRFASIYGGEWQEEDTSEYTLAFPWSVLTIDPCDPQVQIRPKSDPVFMRYKPEKKELKESVFPEFVPEGISSPVISNVVFERHTDVLVTVAELHQMSVNYNRMVCTLDKAAKTAVLSFAFNFSDSANRLSYFDFSFEAAVSFEDFDRYIEIGDWFCIDYHLRDYLVTSVLESADKELLKYTAGTDLAHINLSLTMDKRAIRQMYYRIIVDGDKYLVVKDAQIHN